MREAEDVAGDADQKILRQLNLTAVSIKRYCCNNDAERQICFYSIIAVALEKPLRFQRELPHLIE